MRMIGRICELDSQARRTGNSPPDLLMASIRWWCLQIASEREDVAATSQWCEQEGRHDSDFSQRRGKVVAATTTCADVETDSGDLEPRRPALREIGERRQDPGAPALVFVHCVLDVVLGSECNSRSC